MKSVVLIGIASNGTTVSLAVHALKAYALQFEDIRANWQIEALQFPWIQDGHEEQEKEAYKVIYEMIDHYAPDILGLSVYAWNIPYMLEIAKHIRKYHPSVYVIMGGPEIDGKTQYPNVDQLVIGEGEIPFVQILRNEPVPGVQQLESLTDLPSVYGKDAPIIYLGDELEALVETQRGCNLKCSFCQYHKNFPTIRYRDPMRVVDDIEYIYHYAGTPNFRVTDGNFLSNKARAKLIMRELIRRDIRLTMVIEALPGQLDQELAQLFKDYVGLSQRNHLIVAIGLQSVNTEALKVIHRNTSKETFARAYALLEWADCIINTSIILGLPRETKQTFYECIEFLLGDRMRNTYNHIPINLLMVLPGSDMEEIADRENLTLEIGKRHFVYETPTLPRADMVDCLRVTAVAYKIFNVWDDVDSIIRRNYYYRVKDKHALTHIQLLTRIIDMLMVELEGTAFAHPDFPDAEQYWCYEMHAINFTAIMEDINAQLSGVLQYEAKN